jgi:Type I restriction modification DNA specificity domain
LITEVFDYVEASKAWIDNVHIDRKGVPEIPLVTNKLTGNGISELIPLGQKDAKGNVMSPNPGNTITVPFIAPFAAYQAVPFYTGQNVHLLRAERLSAETAAVLIPSVVAGMQAFDWSTKATARRLYRSKIMVPVTEEGEVDWDAMERLGGALLTAAFESAGLVAKRLAQLEAPSSPPILSYAPRLITEVFTSVEASKSFIDGVRVDRHGRAEFPYVTRSSVNNGVSDIIPRQAMDPNPGNVIAVGLDTQTATYQPHAFYTGQNVQVLRSPELDAETAAVLVPIVRKQLAKFSWGGNGATLGRLRRSQIMVPTLVSGEIDWAGMRAMGTWLLQKTATSIKSAKYLPDLGAQEDEAEGMSTQVEPSTPGGIDN